MTKRKLIQRPMDGWDYTEVTTHPGELLREEFLKPLGLSANQLALRTRMPATRVNEILHERRSVTPDTALRLARFFGTSAEFWLSMQRLHDLTKLKLERDAQIEQEVMPLQPTEKAA